MWLNKYNEDKSDKKKFIRPYEYDNTYILDLKKKPNVWSFQKTKQKN